jgi:hypothetical protein
MSGTSGISDARREEWSEESELSSSGWLASLPHEETESRGVTLEGTLPSIEELAGGVVVIPTPAEGEAAAWSENFPPSCSPHVGSGTGRGEGAESEDKRMGASGMSPIAGRGVMRDGE